MYFEFEDYKPDITSTQDLTQHSVGLSFDWTINPRAVLSIGSEFSHNTVIGNSPAVGKDNLDQQAGIQGFPTSVLGASIGLPTVGITAFSGFSYPTQVPSSFKRELMSGTANLILIRSNQTITLGVELSDRRTATHHFSSAPRGSFTFNGQYTGNSFADYLLGLVQSVSRNLPLDEFGIGHAPYQGLFAQDDVRVSRRLTLNVGVRWDYWRAKAFVRGCGATWDPVRQIVLAGENSSGQTDLSCQAAAPFVGAATAGLWIPASKAGVPGGLFEPTGFVSPRIGFAWRPTNSNGFVVRGAWGIFTSSYQGNTTASSILGLPYSASEALTFAKATLQPWETAFPATPNTFSALNVVNSAYNLKPNVVEQWNFSIQKAIPFLKSAVTVSYFSK